MATLAIMAVVSTALGWLMAGRALRPLQAMTDSIQRISARIAARLSISTRIGRPGTPERRLSSSARR